MCQPPIAGAAQAVPYFGLPVSNQVTVRHILLGDYPALMGTIHHLVSLGYCERIAWSEPTPTSRDGEYISVMTRKRALS